MRAANTPDPPAPTTPLPVSPRWLGALAEARQLLAVAEARHREAETAAGNAEEGRRTP
ncbi:MAG TPA: hypothetical protein VKU00_19925 [Chthonomonadaceae bacterium]|nr:hypothetical protein [Chthonomonadaceae bacterium]